MTDAVSSVVYKDIPDYPGYRVGDDGNVWSAWRTCPKGRFVSTWRQMKQSPGARGYLRVNLTDPDGKVRMFRVHHLVLLTFVGPCPAGMECRHLNGTKTDNHLTNLVWGTPLQNRDDNRALDVYGRGEGHTQAKLSDDAVRSMRRKHATGNYSQKELADEFHVSVPTVSMIVNGKTWKHIA